MGDGVSYGCGISNMWLRLLCLRLSVERERDLKRI